MPQQPPVCTIGPAARVTGVPPWKLRAWETAGFLRPRRSSGGYRLYEQTDLEHIIWLRDVEARYGRLGVHAMAQAPPPKHAAEKPPGAGEGSHRALTAALRACRTAAGASWCGLIWRGPDARMAIVAADGRTRSAESALSPQEQREWERVVLSFQPAPPLPALTPFAPEQLDALLVRVGRSRGAIVLAQARTALDAGASQLAVRAVEAAVDVAALDRRAGRLQQRMSAIRALGRALARHRELRPLLQEAVERLASDTGMEAALIALVDRAERRLIVEAARGVSPAFVAGIRDWKVDEGVAGRAHTGRKPMIVSDLRSDPRVTRRAVRAEGLRSYVSVPLLHAGRSHGVVELGSRREDVLDQDDIEFILLFAEMLAVVVGNVRLAGVHPQRDRSQPTQTHDAAGDGAAGLSERELRALQLFAESYSTAEVAALLGISTKTLMNFLTGTYRKLGVTGRTQAVTEAIRRSLVRVEG